LLPYIVGRLAVQSRTQLAESRLDDVLHNATCRILLTPPERMPAVTGEEE
jgi:hypothetical protein